METAEVISRTKWTIDPLHSQIGFKVKHLVFTNVFGSFKEFDTSIYTTGNDFTTAEIDLWIDPASIDTGNQKRDAHLRSADFFDVEHFKEISFIANTFAAAPEEGHYELHGELTIRGIKKKVKLDVTTGGLMKDPWGIEKALFDINGKINRKDWGLNWNATLETGGFLVSEDVWINCQVQLIRSEAGT